MIKNEKGNWIFEVIASIVFITAFVVIIAPYLFDYMDKKNIPNKIGALSKDLKKTYGDKETSESSIHETNCKVSCIDDKQTIEINGEIFYLGKIKNSWGDLEGVKCQ